MKSILKASMASRASIVVLLAGLSLSTISFAEKAASKDKLETKVTTDNFVCQKHRKSNLAELKLKLLDECDLNKPFSSSIASAVGDGDTAQFCCHAKSAE